MVADVSAITYFAPVLAFLLVFVVVFAVLYNTKILGELLFVQLLVSFVIASVFVSAASAREYVVNVSSWFAVVVVSLFFLLFLLNFAGKIAGEKWVTYLAVIVLLMIFLVSALNVFGSGLGPYLPGSYTKVDGNPAALGFFDWLYSAPVVGALLLILSGAIVSWVLVKAAK
jgi:hypothetical protein